MELSQKQYNILFLAIISVILFVTIFKWINYLIYEKYIMECFTTGITEEKYDGSTSHTVNLPLTTTYSCKNFCGPTARCSITGHQCSADIDCPGCQPYVPPYVPSLEKTTDCVQGNNDAGKLTVGITPQYSPLTSGYGTQQTMITSNMYSKPDVANFGVDVWSHEFNEDQKLFDKRYKPTELNYMPNYPKRYSLTGNFIEDGPYASNAHIPTQ
jgi:hypothetical protein